MNNNQKLAALYKHVPPAQRAALDSFRHCYPYRTLSFQEQAWSFLDTEDGKTSVLLLAGATAVATLSFRTIEHLARRYRVIAPDYPPIERLQPLFAGYLELLERLDVGPCFLMGGSYGGWMTQAFLEYDRDRFQKAIISAVGPPNPENSRQLARLLPFLRLMPTFLVRAFLLRSFARLAGDDSGDGERALLLAHTEEIVRTRLQRADVVALMARLIDQTENDPYTASGSLAWSGPTLLLFGSDDPVAPPDKREALRRRYPQAEVCVIDGADHTMALSHRQAYYGAIDAFLAAEKKPGVITTRSR